MKILVPLLTILCLLFSRIVQANDDFAFPSTPQQLVTETVKIADQYAAMNWFNGTIEIRYQGKTILNRSWGLADREHSVQNTAHTLYNLGSIMKHVTATLVLKHIQNGQLSMDNRLSQFDLGFKPDVAKKITIRHLLKHTSGLPDIFIAKYRENQLAYDTLEKRLSLLIDTDLLFEPGTDRRYSNYGYVVLAAILEKRTGQDFTSLIYDHIFTPLGLENSFYPYPDGNERLSKRYTFTHDSQQKFVGKTEHHGPDGGIEATTSDILDFYTALYKSDRFLDRKNPDNLDYFKFNREAFGAFGGGAGVSTAVELDLKNDYQIAVLSNSDQLVAERISGRLMKFIKTGHYTKPQLPPVAYAFKQYKKMGLEKYRASFRDQYKKDGYRQFIGRTLNELALSLAKDQSWDDAFHIIKTLDHYFPKHQQVYDSIAYIHFLKGETDKAQEAFKMALQFKPDYKSNYSQSGYGLMKKP